MTQSLEKYTCVHILKRILLLKTAYNSFKIYLNDPIMTRYQRRDWQQQIAVYSSSRRHDYDSDGHESSLPAAKKQQEQHQTRNRKTKPRAYNWDTPKRSKRTRDRMDDTTRHLMRTTMIRYMEAEKGQTSQIPR